MKSMKTIAIWALLAANGVLMAELVSNYAGEKQAHAARGRRPDIIMIPGQVVGDNSSVVYIIDSANRRLGAVALDNNGRELVGLRPQELDRVFDNGGGGAGGGNNRRGR